MAELLKVENLFKHFPLGGFILPRRVRMVRAVDGVSFRLKEGKTLSLVGESGCGKSTLARLILRLIRASGGKIIFDKEEVFMLKGKSLKNFRKQAQIVFQDPYSSLNPRQRVEQVLKEPLLIHYQNQSDMERKKKVDEVLNLVGLATEYRRRYPNELSGGERGRIGIARALALNPKFIVLDEPLSALDVSIQAKLINLLKRLQQNLRLTYLFISHDLRVVKFLSDEVAVMHLGKIVEQAPREELYESPYHPYTQALLSAIPVPHPKRERERKRIILQGDPPSALSFPSGCRFRTRCPLTQDICGEKEPSLRKVAPSRLAACHFAAPNPIPLS